MGIISKGVSVYTFGSSITNPGSAASPLSLSWANQMSAWLGMKLFNQGASGNGMWKAQNNAFTNMPQVGNNSMVLIESAYNDMRAAGASAKNLNMISGCLRGIVANSFLGQAVAASQATLSGTYSATFQSSTVGGKANRINSADRGVILQASSSFVEWTFEGDNIVFGFIGTDGTVNDYGAFEVFVDGFSRGIYNSNDYATGVPLPLWNHQYCPCTLVFGNLIGVSHSIKIVSLDSRPVIVDYFGIMKNPSLCKPVVINHCLKMTATGYVSGSITNGSDAAVDAINNEINKLKSTFCGYQVAIVKTVHYDPYTGISGDEVHPSNTGHQQILNDLQSQITIGPANNDAAWDSVVLSGANIVDTSGIVTTTATSGGYGNLAMGDKFLLDGQDGAIKNQYVDTEQRLHVFGFNNTNYPVPYSQIDFGWYYNSTGFIIKVQNGSTINTGIQAIAGMHYGAFVEGEDVELRSSVDGDQFTFLASFSNKRTTGMDLWTMGDFYGAASPKQMNYPKGFNLI